MKRIEVTLGLVFALFCTPSSSGSGPGSTTGGPEEIPCFTTKIEGRCPSACRNRRRIPKRTRCEEADEGQVYCKIGILECHRSDSGRTTYTFWPRYGQDEIPQDGSGPRDTQCKQNRAAGPQCEK